ncbi:hypothetical protein D9M70_519070 [compost metagenome]
MQVAGLILNDEVSEGTACVYCKTHELSPVSQPGGASPHDAASEVSIFTALCDHNNIVRKTGKMRVVTYNLADI